MADTQQDWRTLPAGRELDAVVAERVMGWAYWLSKRGHYVVQAPGEPSREPFYGTARFDGDNGHPIVRAWWEGADVPAYSDDIAAAWQVVEAMRGKGWWMRLNTSDSPLPPVVDRARFARHNTSGWDTNYVGRGDTAPLAICRAALAAVTA